MLKGRDLRIGNWIAMLSETTNTEDTYYTWQIKSGAEIDLIREALNNKSENELVAYKPIDLTPAILINFGFLAGSKSDYFIAFKNSIGDKKLLYIGRDEGSYFWGVEEDLKSVPIEKISYLHQLQNIYYSLCGEELKLVK